MPKELKLKSHDLLVGPDRAPARAMLKAVGFTDEEHKLYDQLSAIGHQDPRAELLAQARRRSNP